MNNWKQFLIDMGWDETKYGWTKEKARVKKLLKEQGKTKYKLSREDWFNYFQNLDGCYITKEAEEALFERSKKVEGVFKKMGLDEKFMEFLEDTGITFITTKKK